MCVRQSLKDTLVQHGAEEEELKEATLQLDLAADILLLGSLAKAEAAKANGKGRFAKWQATVAEIVVVRPVVVSCVMVPRAHPRQRCLPAVKPAINAALVVFSGWPSTGGQAGCRLRQLLRVGHCTQSRP